MKSRSMILAEEIYAQLEVVSTLVSVLDDYTSRYMKSRDYVNTAGQYIAGEMSILLGVAESYLTEIQDDQSKLVSMLVGE